MPSLLETHLGLEKTELICRVLEAQVETYGTIELPEVERFLRENSCKKVLDIGTGEGSFITKLASAMPDGEFLGIDQNVLMIEKANEKAERQNLANVSFMTQFFDDGFSHEKRDAILTRYTLQHCSKPQDFLQAAYNRLEKNGLFIAIDSLPDYANSHEDAPIWEEHRSIIAKIHESIGTNPDIHKSVASFMQKAGFKHIQVWIRLFSPATVGYEAFRLATLTNALIYNKVFGEIFSRAFLGKLERWLENKKEVARQDPNIPNAFAVGKK